MAYRIAGIDVHKKMLVVVVSDVEVDGGFQFERQRFGGNPEQLRSLAAWLLEQEAEEIVMESTAQSTVSTDLAHPASGSSLRRTGPSGHQRIEAKAYLEDDPATPKAWLPDRIAESSTHPSTSAVIFDPGYRDLRLPLFRDSRGLIADAISIRERAR